MTRIVATVLLAIASSGGVFAQSFEVASVKPSPPIDYSQPPNFGCTGGPGTDSPGQFTCRYISVEGLAILAYELKGLQLPNSPNGGRSVYHIVAKVPPEATREQLRGMIQNLLAERFKLTFHYEKKPVQVYDLVVAKGGPKLRESTPGQAFRSQPDEFGFPPPPAAYRGTTMTSNSRIGVDHWVARGATSAQIVRLLSSRLRRPVTDLTGLKGQYDFDLNFSVAGLESTNAALGEIENTAPTIFDAIKTLGIVLERKPGSIDMFIVDHVEKTPIEN